MMAPLIVLSVIELGRTREPGDLGSVAIRWIAVCAVAVVVCRVTRWRLPCVEIGGGVGGTDADSDAGGDGGGQAGADDCGPQSGGTSCVVSDHRCSLQMVIVRVGDHHPEFSRNPVQILYGPEGPMKARSAT